jgi:predicted  nucleic acid-binding Zn-ribbon protein
MKRKSLHYHFALGLLVGALILPPSVANAQWTVYDPAQYTLQVAKKVEEANRWIQHYTNLVQQLTTLGGVLKAADDLVAKQKNAITTMSNIGRTVRASFQLKDQLEAIVTTRLNMIKRIDDRLRNGIFDPEADLRDLDEYLRNSIGRSSQDLIANRERLVKMDNQLELWQRELSLKEQKKSWAEGKQKTTEELLHTEDQKPDAQKCSSCIASLKDELANYEILIGQLEVEILDLRCQIENRVKQYNIQMQERVRFGDQVQSMNDAWSQFNNSLDALQRALSKAN